LNVAAFCQSADSDDCRDFKDYFAPSFGSVQLTLSEFPAKSCLTVDNFVNGS